MRLRTLAILALAFSIFGYGASAQSSDSAKEAELQQRVEQLEKLVLKLQEHIETLEQKAVPTTAEGSDSGASLEALDQKLRIIERKRELEQEEAATKAKESPILSAGRDGFSISSADKTFKLRIGGYFQADGKNFYDDRSHLATNSFGVRRARLILDGTVGRYVEFRFAPDFGNGTALLYDAYADLKFQPFAVFRAGKFKAPLGLETLQNDTELTFIERALPSSLIPNRDTGLELYGDIAGRLGYAVAVMNGALDGANIDGDTNDGKDVVARIFATPFSQSGPQVLRGLGFEIGTSSGRQNGTSLPTLKSTGGQATFFAYSSTASAAGRRLRYSPQLYYYNGPFGLFAEYAESTQAVSSSSRAANISNHAWQATGSWVLTGEKKSYKGVAPRKNLENAKYGSGFGAWEVAARYTALTVDPTAFDLKFADPTKSANAARAWALGLNWYVNRNARISFDYEQTHFNGGAATGNRPTEKALLNRVQVTF